MVSSNLDESLTHLKGWDCKTDDNIEQNPIKQKHFVGAFTIIQFHCGGIEFEEVIIYGRVYEVHCDFICEHAYITNHFFHLKPQFCYTLHNQSFISMHLNIYFNQVCKLAFEAYDSDLFQTTIGYSHYAYSLMEQNPNIKDSINYKTLANLYHNLGFCYMKIYEIKKGFYWLKKELDIYLNMPKVKDENLLTCLRFLGYIYYKLRQYDTSIDYCKRALSIWIAKFDINHSQFGHLYTMLGIAYFRTEQFDKGQECFEKSLEIYLK
ncbi:hypothetical protein RFI_37526, partial [Reticulomyxa filosa]